MKRALALVGLCCSVAVGCSGSGSSPSPGSPSGHPPADVRAAQAAYQSVVQRLGAEIIATNSLLQGCQGGTLTRDCRGYATHIGQLSSALAHALAVKPRARAAAVRTLVSQTVQLARDLGGQGRGIGRCAIGGSTNFDCRFVGMQGEADQLATLLRQWVVLANDAPAVVPSPSAPPKPVRPVTYTGSGDDVLRVHMPGGHAGIITASYGGSSNFIVDAHGYGSELAGGENLINTIGVYHGTVPVDFDDGRVTSLQVQAQGPWKFRFAPAARAPKFDGVARGGGDTVLLYAGSASIFHLTNSGQSNFIVDEYGGSAGQTNLVNVIGHYSGTVEGEPGPGFVVISSDGNWTIKAK